MSPKKPSRHFQRWIAAEGCYNESVRPNTQRGKAMTMSKEKIRPLALCVFRRGDAIFAAAGYDATKNQRFYRPIGGKIEFGEYGAEAVQREVLEEIGAPITDVRYLGTLENLFTYNGTPGHEICLIYDGRFVEDFRNVDSYTVEGSDDGNVLYQGEWIKLALVRAGAVPLYPNGLLRLLEADLEFY
jgi:8-oxo-dGTP pyrophosphatase MutT (NUDIX family)